VELKARFARLTKYLFIPDNKLIIADFAWILNVVGRSWVTTVAIFAKTEICGPPGQY